MTGSGPVSSSDDANRRFPIRYFDWHDRQKGLVLALGNRLSVAGVDRHSESFLQNIRHLGIAREATGEVKNGRHGGRG